MLNTSDEELKNLRNNILISIQTIKQEVNEQKERYRQQMIPLENQLNLMPTNERELTKIMREKGIKETLFLYLLQKREETALNVAAQVAHSRLLERAVNRGKISPKPLQMALFYIFLGLGLPICQGYGLSEASPLLTVKLLNKNDPTTIGMAVPGVEFRVAENGGLFARGPNIMMGYWNNPEATRAVLSEDGWLTTGDQVKIDEKGFVARWPFGCIATRVLMSA